MRIAEIIKETAIAFDVTPEQMMEHRGGRRVEMARGCAMYLARRYTDRSLPLIGREFGGRNHSTVIKAIKNYPARASWYGFAENMLNAQNAVASR